MHGPNMPGTCFVTPVLNIPTGYLAPEYAASLAEFGEPLELPQSRGWLLKRAIPGTGLFDAMGCYPLFSCRDWTLLGADLETVGRDLVCFSAVADPFGDYDEALLRSFFPDLVFVFKSHFVTDLTQTPGSYVSKHHQRLARHAARKVRIERCENPSVYLDEWTQLYSGLVKRHSIRGISAFSREAFAKQLQVPGLVAFRATLNGETVSMTLWYVQGGVAYYHLAASNDMGYKTNASFALFWHSIEHFSGQKLNWLDLGSGAGLSSKEALGNGLSAFKSGWSTGTRPAFFCSRVFNREAYDAIVKAKNNPPTSYFPAYRLGDL
jgi:hypothetical protein